MNLDPAVPRNERESFWTDLSEVPDEQYRDEDEPEDRRRRSLSHPRRSRMARAIVPPEES